MQRLENETFARYKARRAIANAQVKDINGRVTQRGGSVGTREQLRSRGTFRAYSTGIKGMKSSNNTAAGAGFKAHFDGKNNTAERLATHKAYLARCALTRATRCSF